MKLSCVAFYGFNRKELENIRKETGLSGEEDFSLNFGQTVSDIVGFDVMTLVGPDGQISIIKAGE